jgi:hypothetical protein
MRGPKRISGIAIFAFGAGLFLSSLLPSLALVCIVSILLMASGALLFGR